MKTAQEWQDELAGETSLESIRAIQADAMTHAARNITAHADSPERGFRAILKDIDALENAKSSNARTEPPAPKA
jgi:hypothetical protein